MNVDYRHLVSLALGEKWQLTILLFAIPLVIVGLIVISSLLFLGVFFLGSAALCVGLGMVLKQRVLKIVATNVVWEIPIGDKNPPKTFLRAVRQHSLTSQTTQQESKVNETIEEAELDIDLDELHDLYSEK